MVSVLFAQFPIWKLPNLYKCVVVVLYANYMAVHAVQ